MKVSILFETDHFSSVANLEQISCTTACCFNIQESSFVLEAFSARKKTSLQVLFIVICKMVKAIKLFSHKYAALRGNLL